MLIDFINQNFDKPNVGDTTDNKGQCVGLVEVWTDYLGLSHTWGNAKDLISQANNNQFDIILNNPNDLTLFPKFGDIVCFNWPPYGHTGICLVADGNSMLLFEQNDPLGGKPTVKQYSFNGCIGWLHPKDQSKVVATATTIQVPMPITDQTQIDMGPSLGQMEVQAIRSKLSDDVLTITKLQSSNFAQSQSINDLTQKLTDCQNRPAQIVNLTNPKFNTSLGQFLYNLAKQVG